MPIKNDNKTTHEKLSAAGHKGAEARRGPDGSYYISDETREKLSEAGKKGASVRYGKDYMSDENDSDSKSIMDRAKDKVHEAKEAVKSKFHS